jgi:hypothetical protein
MNYYKYKIIFEDYDYEFNGVIRGKEISKTAEELRERFEKIYDNESFEVSLELYEKILHRAKALLKRGDSMKRGG